MTHPGSDRRYVRAVEAAWSRVQGKPAVVSPREFETIDGWRRRGIPLTVVLEVIAAAGKRRSGRAPKALTSLAHEVQDAWSVVAAGRSAHEVGDVLPARREARLAWANALERCPPGGPLHRLLARLLDEEREGGDAAALDAALDESLPGAVPHDTLVMAEDETARSLERFRPRMSEDEFKRTTERAVVDRLRTAFALPRLVLTR